LATLSLDLELFVGWHFWFPATVTLQTLAQVGTGYGVLYITTTA